MIRLTIVLFLSVASYACMAQSSESENNPKWDYKIYLKKPAKLIERIMNCKDSTLINGSLSENKTSVVMTNYVPGVKVRVNVVYEDGAEESFETSPCFIDPIIP